jgi:hypothetical protein
VRHNGVVTAQRDESIRLPGSGEHQSDSQYVHTMGWEDWASQLADSVVRHGLRPEGNTYVLLAVSGALSEHRAELAKVLPTLSAMSECHLQIVLVGADTAQTESSAQWDEFAVAECLRDLASAAGWDSLPRAAVAALTCRREDSDEYHFDLECYFMIKDRVLPAADFRELLLRLAQTLPDASGTVSIPKIRQQVATALSVGRVKRSAQVIGRLTDAVAGRWGES